MINSAALTAMHSAVGSNCYTMHYSMEHLRRKRSSTLWSAVRRWLALEQHNRPYSEQQSVTWCNVASFAGVQYYNQFWRLQPTSGSNDHVDASWNFHVPPGGDFLCDFVTDLINALAVGEPEFAVEDLRLGKGIGAACMAAMDHTRCSAC